MYCGQALLESTEFYKVCVQILSACVYMHACIIDVFIQCSFVSVCTWLFRLKLDIFLISMHSNFIFSSWLVQSAVGWDYQAQLAKHQSQTDAAKGFGGKFGVQKDKKDKVMAIDKISVTRTSCLFSNFFF